MIYNKPATKKAVRKKPVLGPPAPRRTYTGKGPGSSYVAPATAPTPGVKKGVPFNQSPWYVPGPKTPIPNRTPPDRMPNPTVNPVIKKKVVVPATRPAVGVSSAAPPASGGNATNVVAPAPSLGSSTPTGGGTLGGSAATKPSAIDPATAYLNGQRKSLDLQQTQNAKDLVDFRNWYSSQQDTAEKFLTNRFQASADNTKAAAQAALDASMALKQQNLVSSDGGGFGAYGDLIGQTENLGTMGQADNAQFNEGSRNAAASLVAGQRSVDNARVSQFRNLGMGLHNQRLNDLDKAQLENIYKQQQLNIDRGTAEALGAKNIADSKLGAYQAETDRQRVLNTGQYNTEKLRIDRAYKAKQISLEERRVLVEELNASAGVTGNVGKTQTAARKIAVQSRNQWQAATKSIFGGKTDPVAQRALLERTIEAIQNDLPDITIQQIYKALKAEFGASAVALLNGEAIRPMALRISACVFGLAI